MKKKIFITFVLLILIGIFTTGILSWSLLESNYRYNIKDKLITNLNLIVESLHDKKILEKDHLMDLASSYSNKASSRVTFINRDGWVIADSEADPEKLENHKNRPEIKIAFEGSIGISERYSNSLGTDMLYVAIPFDRDDNELAVVRLSVPLKEITNFNKTLFNYIFISAFAGIMVALLLGIRYVNTITEPIRELTIATKRISEGNYGGKVFFKTDDELGVLANNFNTMSKKLSETINELQDKNTKLSAILTSMMNGVIAIDNSKKITFINTNAEEIFGINQEDVRGKHVLEVVRNSLLYDLIDGLISENVISKREIEIFEPRHRILNLFSNPVKLQNNPNRIIGIVIIVQDITEIRKLEKMRKDFVANVSHELKTPLTSIKGFVETLKDGAVEDKNTRNKFLNIIDIETSRLHSLIEDLLTLSEIENNNKETKEIINTNKSINEILQIMDEISRQKDIKIVNKVNNNLPNLHGNRGWFKQMIINLIDNGIKYTPKGGKVTVTAYNTSSKLYIKISDTGIGIEEQHIARLFERFYRVDKARSRQVGGTGLGLAIVKHIVLAFNGSIDIKSEINKGTEFTIILPID